MDETNILLPDGEYDIQISSSLQEKLSQVSKGQNSDINYASDTDDDQGLFQLKCMWFALVYSTPLLSGSHFTNVY